MWFITKAPTSLSGRPRLQLLCSQDASADADQFSSGVKWGILLCALLGTKSPDRGGGDGGSWRWVSRLLAIQKFAICLTAVIGNWHSEMGSGFLIQKHLVRNVVLYSFCVKQIVMVYVMVLYTFLHISQVGRPCTCECTFVGGKQLWLVELKP